MYSFNKFSQLRQTYIGAKINKVNSKLIRCKLGEHRIDVSRK